MQIALSTPPSSRSVIRRRFPKLESGLRWRRNSRPPLRILVYKKLKWTLLLATLPNIHVLEAEDDLMWREEVDDWDLGWMELQDSEVVQLDGPFECWLMQGKRCLKFKFSSPSKSRTRGNTLLDAPWALRFVHWGVSHRQFSSDWCLFSSDGSSHRGFLNKPWSGGQRFEKVKWKRTDQIERTWSPIPEKVVADLPRKNLIDENQKTQSEKKSVDETAHPDEGRNA